MMEAKANSRPGSLLEHLVADVFIEAGFEVQQNKYLMGHEIDVLAELGDTRIIIECKQYENSYLSVKNLIYTWHGKNQEILADKVLFVIYGVHIKEEEYKLAEDHGISIWNIDVINTIKSLTGDREKFNEIWNLLNIQEKSISASNWGLFNSSIMFAALKYGQCQRLALEKKYEMFRNCLRNRLIRNLKIDGSTPELRRQHINFFEHAIDHTETKKQLFFFKKVVDKSNENIWFEIRQKLSNTSIFPKTIVKQYIQYMDDLEDGFSQYEYDFYSNNEHTMKNLIGYRLLSLKESDFFMLQIEQAKSDNKNPEHIFILVQPRRIGIFVENYSAIKILEWILTATHYNCFNKRFFHDAGKQQQEIHLNLFWNTTDIDETVNFVYRIITEFYEVQDPKLIRDISLSVQLTE